LFFIQSQEFGGFWDLDGWQQRENDVMFCRLWEAVSSFYHTTYGGGAVFGLEQAIP